MFIDVDHPQIGHMKVNGNPVKLMDMMPRVNYPAPTLGQDNEIILEEVLGYSKEEVESLRSNKVI